MAIVKDWVRDAAEEIGGGCGSEYCEHTVEDVIEMIWKYCPFKPDMAYEEVGEISRKLDQILKYLR